MPSYIFESENTVSNLHNSAANKPSGHDLHAYCLWNSNTRSEWDAEPKMGRQTSASTPPIPRRDYSLPVVGWRCDAQCIQRLLVRPISARYWHALHDDERPVDKLFIVKKRAATGVRSNATTKAQNDVHLLLHRLQNISLPSSSSRWLAHKPIMSETLMPTLSLWLATCTLHGRIGVTDISS